MEQCETRSSRHLKKAVQQKKKTNLVASRVGVALLSVPLVSGAMFASEEAEAQEYGEVSSVSPQDFVESIGYSASTVADSNGLYASVMIAQALLESGYGNSELAAAPNYNLFGVKGSYDGQSVSMSTAEYVEGEWSVAYEPFRTYSSYYESFQDHVNVLGYYTNVWKSNTSSYADATNALTGTYATDPEYGQKLNALIETYNLTRFDSSYSDYSYYDEYSYYGESVSSDYDYYSPDSESQAVIYAESGLTYYTVNEGDTLWGIAQAYGTTVEYIAAMNGLYSDLITAGQILQVR